MSEQNNYSSEDQERNLKFIPSSKDIFEYILDLPRLHMIWGDIGTGKSTFAIQLAHYCISQQKKVFYMNTKFIPIDSLLQRILYSNLDKDISDFILWDVSTLKEQKEIVFQWDYDLHRLKKLESSIKEVGLLIIDELSPLYLIASSNQISLPSRNSNQDLIFILATLVNLIQKYSIPILIINRFKLINVNNKNLDPEVRPFGGKILKYWFSNNNNEEGIELKLERTSHTSHFTFKIMNIKFHDSFNPTWIWKLKSNGF